MISSANKLFYINSRSRTSGSCNDFVYDLRIPVTENFDRVVVLNATLPKSFYMVQEGENTFYLSELKDSEAVETLVTLPQGNYNLKSLRLTLTGLLNAASPNNWVYNVTYPNTAEEVETGKYTFSVTGSSAQPSIRFSSGTEGHLCEVLGFDFASTNTFIDDSLVSTNIITLQAETTIYLHSDICTNDDDDILQEIDSSGTIDLGSIVWTNPCAELTSKNFANRGSTSFRFYLLNEDNIPINLNGVNFQFTVCLYRQNQYWTLGRKAHGLNLAMAAADVDSTV